MQFAQPLWLFAGLARVRRSSCWQYRRFDQRAARGAHAVRRRAPAGQAHLVSFDVAQGLKHGALHPRRRLPLRRARTTAGRL